jgi:hypothetical protein
MTISVISESRTGKSAALAVGAAGACMSQAADSARDETASARTQTFLLSMVATSSVVHAWRRYRAAEFTANCEL